MSFNALAQAIRVPANRSSLIVNERRAITADTALRLATFFGTSPHSGSTSRISMNLPVSIETPFGVKC